MTARDVSVSTLWAVIGRPYSGSKINDEFRRDFSGEERR